MISRKATSRGHGRYTALSVDVSTPKYRSVRLTRRSRVAAQCIRGPARDRCFITPRVRLDAPGRAVRDEMSHLGRPVTQMKSKRQKTEVAINEGHAFVLAQMLYPRFDHETLDLAAGVFDVAATAPSCGSCSATYPPYLLHDARE